ncbi:hypothetical protein RND71_023601 [Anisodus tanguticus]|uniref:Uncharacterized protein n=1 Tax=Anisodus tanguticus TaxID=243964 RepID=A0AAE1RU62_9SOLA|nr:hypothetical protein RND71_023601 [Anisodus tanguticus]
MAKLSSTWCLFLLLAFAAGIFSSPRHFIILATTQARDAIPNGQCLTNLGSCGSKLCDTQCCEQNCFDNLKSKNPYGICEIIPGSALRLCNCYHEC